MELIANQTAYKAKDGTLFLREEDCILHEKMLDNIKYYASFTSPDSNGTFHKCLIIAIFDELNIHEYIAIDYMIKKVTGSPLSSISNHCHTINWTIPVELTNIHQHDAEFINIDRILIAPTKIDSFSTWKFVKSGGIV